MTFRTKYFGGFAIRCRDGVISDTMVKEIEQAIKGTILVLEIRDNCIYTNGTEEYVDFSSTLNNVIAIAKFHNCYLIGTITTVEYILSKPVIRRFEVFENTEKIESPKDVFEELAQLREENKKIEKELDEVEEELEKYEEAERYTLRYN